MKALVPFLVIFFASSLIWLPSFVNDYLFDERILLDEAFFQVESLSSSKASRISSFFDERKADAFFLTQTDEIKQMFFQNKSTFLQDFNDIEQELILFQEENGYEDLVLLDSNGSVIWIAKKRILFGESFVSGKYNNSILATLFNKVKKNLGVAIAGPIYYEDSDQSAIFSTAPLLITLESGKKELVGVVVLEIDGNKVSELLESDSRVSEIGEVYIVNRLGEPVTLLKQGGFEETIVVDTKIKNDCFTDYNNYYLRLRGEPVELVEKHGVYKNYAGSTVIGAYQYILQLGVCVIAEIDQKSFFEDKLTREKWVNIYLHIFILVAIFLFYFFIENFFSIEQKRGRR